MMGRGPRQVGAHGRIGGLLRRNKKFLRSKHYFAATVYIALGLATVLSSGRHK
jgi:hypothetical protein